MVEPAMEAGHTVLVTISESARYTEWFSNLLWFEFDGRSYRVDTPVAHPSYDAAECWGNPGRCRNYVLRSGLDDRFWALEHSAARPLTNRRQAVCSAVRRCAALYNPYS